MISRRWRWLLLDLVLACLASVAGIGLVREAVEGRSLPTARVLPESNPQPAVDDSTSAPAQGSAQSSAQSSESQPQGGVAQYAVIAARNLFFASRGEVAAVVAPALAGLKSVLHGVVIDGDRSRAYLDDPVAKRVFGYAVGDSVVGGRLERILDDRVVIRRPEGMVEVLLQDPAKPQAEAPPPAAAAVPAPTKARRSAAQSALPTPAPAGAGPAGPPNPGQVSQ
jgi:hypothetical protein